MIYKELFGIIKKYSNLFNEDEFYVLNMHIEKIDDMECYCLNDGTYRIYIDNESYYILSKDLVLIYKEIQKMIRKKKIAQLLNI